MKEEFGGKQRCTNKALRRLRWEIIRSFVEKRVRSVNRYDWVSIIWIPVVMLASRRKSFNSGITMKISPWLQKMRIFSETRKLAPGRKVQISFYCISEKIKQNNGPFSKIQLMRIQITFNVRGEFLYLDLFMHSFVSLFIHLFIYLFIYITFININIIICSKIYLFRNVLNWSVNIFLINEMYTMGILKRLNISIRQVPTC